MRKEEIEYISNKASKALGKMSNYVDIMSALKKQGLYTSPYWSALKDLRDIIEYVNRK